MADLSTTYMGLKLKNPLIVASSGLTDSADKVINLAHIGVGAVVLKSIYEEEILMKAVEMRNTGGSVNTQWSAGDYINHYAREENLQNYLDVIKESKTGCDIPVIASINCISEKEWTSFGKSIEKAGADALEINVFYMPSDLRAKSEDIEKRYFNLIKQIKKDVSIPIALKVGYHFSALGSMLNSLSATAIDGLILFNRYYSPDIDIDKIEITSAGVLSKPEDLSMTLRWLALISPKAQCDLAASTGIHNGDDLIKVLLAGAQVGYTVSSLYTKGTDHAAVMLRDLDDWMNNHSFSSINDFRGKLSSKDKEDNMLYERAQFMKYFSSYKG
jgi:dihydroorotate dehydrogenase (fumarate)